MKLCMREARHHSLVYSPLVKLGSTLIPSQVVSIHVNRRHKQLVPELPTQHKSSTGTQRLQEIFVQERGVLGIDRFQEPWAFGPQIRTTLHAF